MPFYSFNMKKGKYQVEMRSDDVYFARRQVDKLFKELLKMHGKLRVVLPPINSEKIEKPVKEAEKQSVVKESTPENLNTQEKQPVKTVEPEIIKAAETVIEATKTTPKEIEKVVEKVIELEAPAPEEVKISLEEVAEVIESAAVIEENISVEEVKQVIETIDEIIQEETKDFAIFPEEPEEVKEVFEVAEEIAEEEPKQIEIFPELSEEKELEEIVEKDIEQTLFEDILAIKTQEVEETFEEEIQEQPLPKVEPRQKKSFSFKSIIRKKEDNEGLIRQKSGFTKIKAVEPSEERVKPQDVVSMEDEGIAKILEEKIKKSLPPSLSKTISEDISEDEVIPRQGSFEDVMQLAFDTEEPDEDNQENLDEIEELNVSIMPSQDIKSLEELIQIKNPQSKLDYLLLTAFYLQTNENLFKYSLKQLNSKVMPFLGSLIDHSVIHNAVAHDFIEVVPDYSGTAEVTEYRLTPMGEDYLVNGL